MKIKKPRGGVVYFACLFMSNINIMKSMMNFSRWHFSYHRNFMTIRTSHLALGTSILVPSLSLDRVTQYRIRRWETHNKITSQRFFYIRYCRKNRKKKLKIKNISQFASATSIDYSKEKPRCFTGKAERNCATKENV